MLHGCTIGDGSLIGIQAVVMNGAVIGRKCLVGAGAVVTEGKTFPERSLILGAPAKVVRALTDAEIARLERAAAATSSAARYRPRSNASAESAPRTTNPAGAKAWLICSTTRWA